MKKVIIFGTGRRMYEYMMRGVFEGFDIVAYCDNDMDKKGKKIDNVSIITPQELNTIMYDEILIASDRYYKQMKKQLVEECGISENTIVKVTTEVNKYEGEMSFWKAIHMQEGFHSSFYQDYILGVADETDDSMFDNRIVVDFGCGPQGSLAWTDKPKMKIGVDVLAAQYYENFPEELSKHNTIYVTSTEKVVPLPSAFCDILITLNSLDHVYNFESIVLELLRILKLGGILLGGFNLNEPKTECEPQTLTLDRLEKGWLSHFDMVYYKLCIKEGEVIVGTNLDDIRDVLKGREAVLWLRANRKYKEENIL